jgi:pilus assembly protein CpaB
LSNVILLVAFAHKHKILGNGMSSRAVIIAIVLVVVGLTLVSLLDYFTGEPIKAPVEEVQVQRIIVAKRNLISGAFIQSQEDLDWQPVPATAAPAATVADQGAANMPEGEGGEVAAPVPANDAYQYEGSVRLEDFNGAVVRRPIRAGEPIVASMLMKPGEGGFMSAVLEPGKRAVSISVNPISGNAGFVSPGDRVDLLLTYRVKNSANADSGAVESIGTETFARDVRVLAVDQSLDNPENKAILAKTITVEVTPVQAEKISVATEMGKISVALVSTGAPSEAAAGDAKSSESSAKISSPITSNSKTYTMDGDVSSLLGEKESATSKVRIIRGDKIETLEFYQDKQ